MSSLLYRLGVWVHAHHWRVVAAWLVLLIALGALAVGLKGKTDDAFTIPGSSSQVALDQLTHTFPATAGTSAQVLVRVPAGRSVRDADVKKVVEDSAESMSGLPQVATVLSPYSTMLHGQIADSGTALIMTIPLDASGMEVDEGTRSDIRAGAADLEKALPAGSDVHLGGGAFANILPKMGLTEAIGLVFALAALLVLFRSLLASMMPLVTAMVGVGVAMAVVYAAAAAVTISSTAPMLALMLGIAVGIDYALLILSRHRDQLGEGMSVADSISRSVATAGSAVVFAGLTVIIALLGLGVAQIPFLTVMGVGAAVAVVAALAVAVTLLPAVMSIAGERLRPRAAPTVGGHNSLAQAASHRWVSVVTAHPWISASLVLLLVGAMSAPGLPKLWLSDNGSSPRDTEVRVTYDLITTEFGPGHNGPLIVTVDLLQSTDPLGLMADLKTEVEALDGVKLVALSTPNEGADTGILQVVPDTGPHDDATAALVDRIRGEHDRYLDEYGVETAVTGITAIGIDVSERLNSSLVPFGIVVVGLCLVLLMLVFRSIAVPVKATLGYLLSLGASFGLTGLVFGHGVAADFFRVQQAGGVISFLPVIVMGVLFGLAMDYEVFLVSRMSEEYVHGAGAHDAIVRGFTAAAPVVVTAAVIMVSVFASFIPADNANLKPIAFALTVGVFVDAFLVRMTLVPAVMTLLGDRAWWMPDRLARRLPRLDAEGERVVHEIGLGSWPAPGADVPFAARDLRVLGTAEVEVARLGDLVVGPGEAVVIEGPAPAVCSLAYAATGRVTSLAGDLKVAGLVLPQRAREVRRRTAIIDADVSASRADGRATDVTTEVLHQVDEAVSDALPLIALCHPDAVTAPADRAHLAGSVAAYLRGGGTVLITAHHADGVLELLPPGVTVHHLTLESPPALAPPDVPAGAPAPAADAGAPLSAEVSS